VRTGTPGSHQLDWWIELQWFETGLFLVVCSALLPDIAAFPAGVGEWAFACASTGPDHSSAPHIAGGRFPLLGWDGAWGC